MLKLIGAVFIAILALGCGLLTAYAAWVTMYPERGHAIAKAGAWAATVFVFLAFVIIGANGLFAIYQ